MFTGIIEAQSSLLHCKSDPQNLQIKVTKPSNFNDIKTGDSIAVNGVCLTVEAVDHESIQFSVGAETLKVTGWTSDSLGHADLNLERSARLGDRIHGHLVSGHVDGMAKVIAITPAGQSRIVTFELSDAHLKKFIWPKGSVAVNGVSLTVNLVDGQDFEVCLIPETLNRTNLASLHIGDQVSIEVDQWARAAVKALELQVAWGGSVVTPANFGGALT